MTLPLTFKSGLIHGRFHRDGNLYLAGLTSWQSVGHGGDWGSFHRVSYTGRALHLPVAVNTRNGGLELRFAEALEANWATDFMNYKLNHWTYPWTSQYGTRGKIYSINHPGETIADSVEVKSAKLSEDQKSVFLEIPELTQSLAGKTLGLLPNLPDMIETSMGLVLAIEYRLRSADGTEMRHRIHKTIHRVPGDDPMMENTHTHGPITKNRPKEQARKSEILPAIEDGIRVVDITSTGVTLSYDVTQITMKAGERLVIRFNNASEMVHNLVVVKSESDINPVGIAAMTAQQEDFIPKEFEDRILAASPLANPGDTVLIDFTAPGPGTYPYICTFSGHFTMMQGRIVVEP